MPIAKVPILALSGHCAGPFGAEVGLGFGALALAVGGVGVDREARRQGDGGRFDLRGRGGEALELGGSQLDVQARGGVGFVGGRTGVEDRFEGLVFAAGDRRVAGLRFGEVVRDPGRSGLRGSWSAVPRCRWSGCR